MIIERGNVLDYFRENENVALFHGCNAKGVMGAGIAKQIRDEYPEHYKVYKVYTVTKPSLGHIVTTNHGTSESPKIIIAGITQENYGRDTHVRYVNYAALTNTLDAAFEYSRVFGCEIVMPYLPGCGLANGSEFYVTQVINDLEKIHGIEVRAFQL